MATESVGIRIRKARKAKDLTLEQLASAVGLSSSVIYKYESGRIKSIPQRNIEKIADYLNVSVPYLLGYGEDTEATSYYNMSINEMALIDSFRKLPDKFQQAVTELTINLARAQNEDEEYEQLTL